MSDPTPPLDLPALNLRGLRLAVEQKNPQDNFTIGTDHMAALLDHVDTLNARAEAAEAKLAAVRELHARRTRQGDPDHCNHCGTGFAPSYIYPCPTIRALDGKA